jgi:hypothetical protein
MKSTLFCFLLSCILVSAQTLTVTNLPIVKIITPSSSSIPNEPKITATMQIIYNGAGMLNNVTDLPNHYNGSIGIETRGSSSSGFPKKGYGLETRDAFGNSNPVSLLDMPAESDWVLRAMYTDKSDMNDMLAYNLARKQGRYGPRTRYVEVLLNGNYQGIYIFEEKIKRDTNRVDIAKLKYIDTLGADLTGGYILKIDKTTGSSTNVGWNSNFKVANCNAGCNFYTKFQHDYPDESVMHPKQKTYIRQYVDSFETALFSTNYRDPVNGYRKYTTTSTFIDYMLINELSKNVDGYRISTYFYKPKNEKLKMGPVWDYDITFGNANYCQGSDTAGWAYNFNYVCGAGNLTVPAWWERFNSDTNYRNQTKCQYTAYRQTIFSKSAIYAVIDSAALVLRTPSGTSSALKRDSTRWNIIGNYVWPNPTPVPTSYNGEITELKNWLSKRINWLDVNMTGTCIQPTVALLVSSTVSKCVGDSITLQVNGTGPYPEYDWYKNGVKISGATTPIFKIFNSALSDAGAYTCRVKNLYNQEILSAPINVVVNAYPIVSISGNATVCPGNSVALTALGASTYVWSNGQTTSAINPIINSATTLTLQGTSLGCTSTASKTISVFTLPTISVASNVPNVCSGDTVFLTASGANTYTWNNGAIGTAITANPSIAATYTAIGTDANGCTNSGNVSVGILPPPTITITSSTPSVCPSNTAILNASGAINLIWSNGQAASSISVNPSTATSYSVSGMSLAGCVGSQSFTVNIFPLPSLYAYSTINNTCPGTSILIFANGASTYKWNTGQTSNFISTSPQVTTTYTIVGTSSDGCKDSIQYTHNVKPKTQITITANDSDICQGDQVTLTASGATTYNWSNGSNGSSIAVSPTQTTNYVVNGFANGCAGSRSKLIAVTVLPNVNLNLLDSVICGGNNFLTLYGGTPIGGSYSGTNVSGNIFSTTTLVAGFYPIQYSYSVNGCGVNKTDSIEVKVCSGLEKQMFSTNRIYFYPNPFTHSINVKGVLTNGAQLIVYNGLGQIVMDKKINSNTIELNSLTTGQYYFIVKQDNRIIHRQMLVKQ